MIFFCDRMLGKHIPEHLRSQGKNVECHDDYFGKTTQDDNWVPDVTQRGWVIITEESLKRKKSEPFRRAIRDHAASCFAVRGSNLGWQQKARLLLDIWRNMERIAKRTQSPFLYRVYLDRKFRRMF